MYTNSAAIVRGDIAGVVEQAKDYEAGLIGVQAMPILDVPVRAGQYPSFVLKEGQLLKSDVKNRAAYSAKPLPDPIPLKIQSPISKIQSPISPYPPAAQPPHDPV